MKTFKNKTLRFYLRGPFPTWYSGMEYGTPKKVKDIVRAAIFFLDHKRNCGEPQRI